LDGVPDSLRTRILEALRESEAVGREAGNVPRAGQSLPDRLRAVAGRLLVDVQSAPSSRQHAMTLLAADALMTYACEAEAAREPHAEPR
jgi:hypothetical protein